MRKTDYFQIPKSNFLSSFQDAENFKIIQQNFFVFKTYLLKYKKVTPYCSIC